MVDLVGKVVRLKGTGRPDFEGSVVRVVRRSCIGDEDWRVESVYAPEIGALIHEDILVRCLDTSEPRNVRIPLNAAGG